MNYLDSCPECDSLNVRVVDDQHEINFTVYCYDCCHEWVEWREEYDIAE